MQFVLLQSSVDRKEQNWRAVKIFDSKQLWLMLLFTWVFQASKYTAPKGNLNDSDSSAQ